MEAIRIIRKVAKYLRKWLRKHRIFSNKHYGTPRVYLGRRQK
jgi:hypothetical protein